MNRKKDRKILLISDNEIITIFAGSNLKPQRYERLPKTEIINNRLVDVIIPAAIEEIYTINVADIN